MGMKNTLEKKDLDGESMEEKTKGTEILANQQVLGSHKTFVPLCLGPPPLCLFLRPQ